MSSPTMLNPQRITIQARARMTGGESHQSVFEFLQFSGLVEKEAADLFTKLQRERLAAIQTAGTWRTLIGGGLLAIPMAVWGLTLAGGFVETQLLVVISLLGLVGLYQLTIGLLMQFRPDR